MTKKRRITITISEEKAQWLDAKAAAAELKTPTYCMTILAKHAELK